MDARNVACDKLLAARVESKMRGNKVQDILHRIHVAQPQERDDISRPSFIPDTVASSKKFDLNDPDRRKLERDVELENGGAGVYNINLKSGFHLIVLYS